MQRYARVTDGIVSNVCVGTNLPDPFIACPDQVSIGWKYQNGSFAPPLIPQVWTSYEFLQRFTSAERRLVWSRAKNDDDVAEFLMFSQSANEVQSDDPATVAGMNLLVEKNILTPARRAEILS